MFLSDEGPVLETLDLAFCIGSLTHATFYISICILTCTAYSVHYSTFILAH